MNWIMLSSRLFHVLYLFAYMASIYLFLLIEGERGLYLATHVITHGFGLGPCLLLCLRLTCSP
jgi:hypothetical protein